MTNLSNLPDLDSINRGFSGKAPLYDAYGEGHPVIRWARGRVRAIKAVLD